MTTSLVLIDTSCWTQALRVDGVLAVRERVKLLISERRAAWCDVIRLELWAGVRIHESSQLKRLEARFRVCRSMTSFGRSLV